MMTLSALDDLSAEPTPDDLAAVVGSAMDAWMALETWLTEEAATDVFEWGSSGKKYGWGLRAKKANRVIAYLIPQHGAFLVGLVLGDKAMAAVADAALSDAVWKVIADAPRYGEGTGFRLPVTTTADLGDIRTLIRIKLAT